MGILGLSCSSTDPVSINILVPPDHAVAVNIAGSDAAATWDATMFQTQLETLIELGPIRPNDVLDSYLEYRARGDNHCPGDTLGFTTAYTLGGCWAENGTYFEGIAWLEVAEHSLDYDIYIDYSFGGDMTIRQKSGDTFTGGGHIDVESNVDDDNQSRSTDFSMAGSWQDTYRPNWVGRGYSGYLTVEASVEDGKVDIHMDGGVGIGDTTVQFDDLSLNDSHETCPSTPMGTIHFRSDDNYWYSWKIGEKCDLCGPIVFRYDTIVEEFCYDISEYVYKSADSILYPERWPGGIEEEEEDTGSR